MKRAIETRHSLSKAQMIMFAHFPSIQIKCFFNTNEKLNNEERKKKSHNLTVDHTCNPHKSRILTVSLYIGLHKSFKLSNVPVCFKSKYAATSVKIKTSTQKSQALLLKFESRVA